MDYFFDIFSILLYPTNFSCFLSNFFQWAGRSKFGYKHAFLPYTPAFIGLILFKLKLEIQHNQDLNLSQNKLTHFPEQVSSLPLLRNLDLGENLIKDLNTGTEPVLASLYGLRYIKIILFLLRAQWFVLFIFIICTHVPP